MAAVKSISPDSTDSKDKMPIIKGKKKEVERNMRSQAHHAQQRANIKKQQITQQLSYIPQNTRTQRGLDVDVSTSTAAHEDDEKHKKMLEHLKSLSPFNGRWEFSSVINSGSYGVVLSVSDVVTKYPGVMKVAKTGVGNDINIQAEWESFLLMKIYKANPEASVCRLLDQGLLQNYDGAPLEYMCLEYVGLRVHEHLSEYIGNDRLLRCCQISLMTLKGIYDIHKEGLIHRDLKPDNMGLISREQPIVMIYDLGMARMYTSKDGKGRPYRSTVGFRGTMEWASGNAVKGREQTRYDDLIAWFYCMIDLFHGNKDSYQVFPWSSRPKNGKEGQVFRSMFAPARYLLRKCPKAFFAINTYLQTAPRHICPDYGYIADRLKDAMEEVVPGSTADLTAMTKPLLPEKPTSGKPVEAVGSKETIEKKNV